MKRRNSIDEIRKLRTGDREASYEAEAPQAVRLRRLLRAELDLAADEVGLPVHELHVPDEAWQDAVEGVLGHNRFTLLVPPAHYDAAMQSVPRAPSDATTCTAWPCWTPNASCSRHLARPCHRLPWRLKFTPTHPAARAFVDLLLGGYVKCDSLEDLREHRTARHPRMFRAPQLHRQPPQPACLPPLVHRRAGHSAPDRAARGAPGRHRR